MNLKPKTLLASLCLTSLVVLAGCGGGSGNAASSSGSSAGQTTKSITVGWYGGPIGEAFKKVVVAGFEKKTGITVNVETAFDDARLTKLRSQPDSLDVAFFTDPVMPQVRAAGLTSDLSGMDIPNLKDVYPSLKSKDSFAWTFGIWGIAYNADKVKSAPTSWSDLLDPALSGHVTEPDITFNSSILTLVAFARLGGGDLNNLQPGFDRMEQLRKLAPFFWASDSQMLPQLQAGNIWMSAYASGGTYQAAKAAGAPPIKFVIPKEGGYLVPFNTVIPKQSKNKAAAAQFANFLLDPQVQQQWAEAIYYAPGNSKTKIPSDIRNMVPTPEQVAQLKDIDWSKFANIRAAVVQEWQTKVH